MNNDMKKGLVDKPRHLIQVVSRRTGISPDVIRAWERRYEAVISHRTPTNRRLYSDSDIEQLSLLKRAINAGRRIGDIARLSYDDLFELVMGDESNATRSYQRPHTGVVMELFDEAVIGIQEMDAHKFHITLSNALATLSTTDFLVEFLKPLHSYINDECKRGAIRYVQEKMAKIAIRTCLSNLYIGLRSSKPEGPKLVCASLTAEYENLDTWMYMIVAQNIGWNITYVGNSIPHDEVSYIANKIEANAVVIALNNPRDMARKSYEIKTIRDNADKKENVILIGTQASEYRQIADSTQAIISLDITSFRLTLERLYSLIR